MDTHMSARHWRRRGAAHSTRQPTRKRERRPRGFLSPGAARLRRFLKCSSHRHARRAIRATLRARLADQSA
jgi:hypothetical protein